MARFAPLLAEHGYRVAAPFSRGYAPTGPAPDGDYHVGDGVYDVIELHRRLGAPRDAVVIGHDWGPFTSNGLAAYPQSPFSQHISMSVPPIGSITADPHTLVRQISGCRSS